MKVAVWFQEEIMKGKINIFVYWQYGVNTREFEKLLTDLNVEKCAYLYESSKDYIRSSRFIPLYLYNNIDFYKEAEIKNELDDEIINKMLPYEHTGMDIVNRWHRSYSSKDDYSTIKEIYYIFLRFWNDFIIKNKIKLLILNIVPHVPAEYIPYALCKAYGIPTIIQGVVPFTMGEKTNYIIKPDVESLDFNMLSRYQNIVETYGDSDIKILLSKEMERYFDQYDPKGKTDKKVIYYNEKNSVWDIFLAYFSRAKIYLRRMDYGILLKKARYLVKARIESKLLLHQVAKLEETPDLSKKYYIFGLHLQPEATTLPTGGVFANQLLAIRMISKYLPKDTYLYVKEHPSYWIQKGRLESIYESRNKDFYNCIKKLRNVVLIDHKISSAMLLDRCMAVVTITGTIGFEAIFKGKPVLAFGPTFYEFFPGVFRIKTNEDCCKAIENISIHKYSYNQRQVAMYLKALEKYIVPMGMNEKNFTDNGVPAVDSMDRITMIRKILQFYEEYYESKR